MPHKARHPFYSWFGGIGFSCFIALLGFGLAKVPYFHLFGAMLLAIVIAIIYRQFLGYPEIFRKGIDFSAKKILRFAIILYGFKLNVAVIIGDGLAMLVKGGLIITLAIVVTMIVAKWLKADRTLSLLLAVGTGVCGAAAIASVAPILKASDEDTAVGVGLIAFIGTIFALGYTSIYAIAEITSQHYVSWSGLSLHEIAHVVAASNPAGQDLLAVALLAKLSRVLLLIPLCFILTLWLNKRKHAQHQTKSKVHFPWFLLGFIATSLMGTYLPIPNHLLDTIAMMSTFLLTAAMVGLGLNVNIRILHLKAFKPVLAMVVASIVISVTAFFIV